MFKKIFLSLLFFSIIFVLGFWLFLESSYRHQPKLTECFKSSRHNVGTCQYNNPNYVRLNEISPDFKNSLLVFEDDKFYKHKGFDWIELKNSFWINLDAGKYERGGSTITQQLVKNLYLSSEKKLYRKIVEAFFTYKIEKNYSKDLILEKYMNIAHFAPKTYGIKKAADRFFKKSPQDLNLLESLFTASVLSKPSVYSRLSKKILDLPPNYKARLKFRLERLHEREQISSEAYEETVPFLTEPLKKDEESLESLTNDDKK